MLLKSLPLVVDLDGTLIYTDTFHEMMVCLLYQKPWQLFFLPFWFLKGRPFAKAQLLKKVSLSPRDLPYNKDFLCYVQQEARTGRPIILATGTPQKLAEKIAEHIGFFHEVIGSTESLNMTGMNKQHALLSRYGLGGFEYAGDSHPDFHVWKVAKKALLVCPKRRVLKHARTLWGNSFLAHFPRPHSFIRSFYRSLRPAFWLVNIAFFSENTFLSLCFFTSGIFILDDLITLHTQRASLQNLSVFARGHLPLPVAFICAPVFIVGALFLWPKLFLYLPFLVGMDLFTRNRSFCTRWGFLTLLHLMAIFFLT